MALVSPKMDGDSSEEAQSSTETWQDVRSSVEQESYLLQRRRVWRPPTDVYETDEQVVIKVEIAGMRADGFQITAMRNRLIIAGQRRDPAGKLAYQNMEIHYGEFRTEVRVDWPLNEAAIEATYDSGFLFVKLPMPKRRQVPVRHSGDATP